MYGLGWPLAISWRIGFSGKGFHILNIVEPSLLSATVTNTSIICAVDSSTLIVTATGGTPGYTYSLVNGSVQASNSFVVIQGIYTLTAIDGNGCAASTIISFTNNDLIPPTIICIDTINILSNNQDNQKSTE